MTVDGLGFDPSPTGYEQLRTERTPDKISHCYRYGDRVIELIYRKQKRRLDLDNEELYVGPWIIDNQPVDPSWFGPNRLAVFLEKAFGLHAEIESWELSHRLPQMTVDPDAGVRVTNLHGDIVETLVPPADGVEPP